MTENNNNIQPLPTHNANVKIKMQTVEAVIIRADGRREELGFISFYHENPLIHYPMQLWIKLKNLKRKIESTWQMY